MTYLILLRLTRGDARGTVEERIERFSSGESQGVRLDVARQCVDAALADE